MPAHLLTRLDVVLAAHGAGDGSAANRRVLDHARALENTFDGIRARAAFHVGYPSHRAALRAATRPHRVVVPMLTSDGYYMAKLRREVDELDARGGTTRLLAPIGRHRLIAESIAVRVAEESRALDAAATNCHVLVIGHGTLRTSNSGRATEQVAASVSQATGMAASIAFLDADPSIEDAMQGIPAWQAVIVVPFLYGGGDHATRDVTDRVARGQGARSEHGPVGSVAVLEPMGELRVIGDILEREILDEVIGKGGVSI